MKPAYTENTPVDETYQLKGGTEANDLPTYSVDGVICSVWVPTTEERIAIAKGENIRLQIHNAPQVPVSMSVTDERIVRMVPDL